MFYALRKSTIEKTNIVNNAISTRKQTFVVVVSRRSIVATPKSKKAIFNLIFETSLATIENDASQLKLNSIYIASRIDFQLINKLIYHVKDDRSRLCISKSCVYNVLKIAHDDNFHVDYHRAYVKLSSIFIRKLSRKLTIYIKHCSTCQLN